MPFSVAAHDRHFHPEHHWKEVDGGLIRPAIEEAGFEFHRDDDDFSSRPIALTIWKKIEESDIVRCDFSSSSPNVFIELGWAMRAEKACVIARDTDHTNTSFHRLLWTLSAGNAGLSH